MVLDSFLYARQQSCITCPDPPPCNCPSDQDCFQINRDCNKCGSFRCVAKGFDGLDGGKRNKGSGKGALAGAVVGSLLFVAIALAIFLWYRHRSSREEEELVLEKDIPASAETVLNRPDPLELSPSVAQQPSIRSLPYSEKVISNSHTPTSPVKSGPARTNTNPFDDQHSIRTAGTEGTNVIPIALATPARSQHSGSSLSGPTRPPRSPELHLNLDHVNVSRDSLRLGAMSTRSGVSAASSRTSYMSNATDFLNEAPMIITPASRQVVGVVKAEVIQTPASTAPTPTTATGLKPPVKSRPSIGSPLALQSFGPSDVASERGGEQELTTLGNPFGDDHSFRAGSPSSITTFGRSSSALPHSSMDDVTWNSVEPRLPWTMSDDSRPTSMSSQAGSIIADIGSATRVFLGPPSSGQTPSTPYRTAIAKLVAPSNSSLHGSLEEQQQRALAHAQARAQAQGLDPNRRISGSSTVSSSTRADSILEAFPFVPPSPISDRPVRSPPVSPIATQRFNTTSPEPPSPQVQTQSTEVVPLVPPDRRTLGMSTGSQLSTASTGLGSFPFQIGSAGCTETGLDNSSAAHSAPKSRTPASLDTLAITNELSSYPLLSDNDTTDGSKTQTV